jgi:molybdate transport system substrate-binding protein
VLTVFAAQSLQESFEAIGREFEAAHPGVRVRLNLAASSALATQIEEGAPADVFASADVPQMQRVARAGLLAGEPIVFARNALVVVVPAANGADIRRVEDLGRPGVSLVLCQPDVPIGHYSRQVIDRVAARIPGYGTAVAANVRSYEPNVRAALARVDLDEVDATFVYRTDAASAGGRVRVIDLPEGDTIVAEYPIATIRASTRRVLADAFIDFVRGPEGQRILRDAGFEASR